MLESSERRQKLRYAIFRSDTCLPRHAQGVRKEPWGGRNRRGKMSQILKRKGNQKKGSRRSCGGKWDDWNHAAGKQKGSLYEPGHRR